MDKYADISGDAAYLRRRAAFDALFVPACRRPSDDERILLPDGFSAELRRYVGQLGGWRQSLCEGFLLDACGRTQHTWRTVGDEGAFASLFRHSNGRHIFVYRTALYGYAVLEVESGRAMTYLPACADADSPVGFDETFIWTSAAYSAADDLLAVDGCFWAAPYTTIVLDFTDPLRPQRADRWLDVSRLLFSPGDDIGDVAYDRWADGKLWLRHTYESPESLCLSAAQLRTALRMLECPA